MEVYRIVLCQTKMCGGFPVLLSKIVHSLLCKDESIVLLCSLCSMLVYKRFQFEVTGN